MESELVKHGSNSDNFKVPLSLLAMNLYSVTNLTYLDDVQLHNAIDV